MTPTFPASTWLSRPAGTNAIALDVWAFVLPAVSFVHVTVVGQLLASDVLALALIPWLAGTKDRLRIPRWFLVLWSGWLLSQIVTDVMVNSPFNDFARGWANIVVTGTNFFAILMLVSTPKRARLFSLGFATAGAIGYFVSPNIYAAFDPWKFAFGIPVALFVVVSLSGRADRVSPGLSIVVLGAAGALNLVFGFRALGGVLLMTSACLLLGHIARRGSPVAKRSLRRAALGMLGICVIAVVVLQGYSAAAAGGLLGADQQTKYLAQSEGALGVILGGRDPALVAGQAIADSPFLGHGSWAKDFKYTTMLADQLSRLGYTSSDAGDQITGLIPSHSYFLGAWIDAGLLGGLFWLAIFAVAVWCVLNLYASVLPFVPLVIFWAATLLWNIPFTPYGFTERLTAPYAIVLCFLGLRTLRRGVDEVDATRPRAMASWAPPSKN